MIDKESDIRPIGYGAMMLEGLVGVVALIAAASMPPELYYDINVDVEKVPLFQKQLQEMKVRLAGTPEAQDQMHVAGVRELHQLNIAQAEEMVGGESLRGRTGGAVTLAVSMATIGDLSSLADRAKIRDSGSNRPLVPDSGSSRTPGPNGPDRRTGAQALLAHLTESTGWPS